MKNDKKKFIEKYDEQDKNKYIKHLDMKCSKDNLGKTNTPNAIPISIGCPDEIILDNVSDKNRENNNNIKIENKNKDIKNILIKIKNL
ncbi:hypothetical protein PBNK65E_000081200 [Plasmodium berghei]|uniref:Uncharacterized protein n=1 Tax=Plasmodium berghei TaxID=5821 RepID=A0A1C6WU52_PLABE|nr:hypothetical protein PBNK65NY_000080800 [Plasmodium berghei]SCM15790.1 hypothetical protein PBSP11A_000080900 [Plasmodium berghei]SCM17585.1 hypothetical protein PBSP11RLL_000081100 [Plasmodium berghei]SCN23063.1 hypothetical protein PBNK65E_000081200 [Plasmodium berghei]